MTRGPIGKGQEYRGSIKIIKDAEHTTKEDLKAFKDALETEARLIKGSVKVSD